MKRNVYFLFLLVSSSVLLTGCGGEKENSPSDGSVGGLNTTIRVPQDYPTIQSALNEAKSGTTILVAPGAYKGNISIKRESITLTSLFSQSGDENDIDQTLLMGGANAVEVHRTAKNAQVIGFSIKDSEYGVTAHAYTTIRNNKFFDIKKDAVGLEGESGGAYTVGGVIQNNYFNNSGDDAIDLDGPGNTLIENNILLNSHNDGIEIRNFNQNNSMKTVTIRNNFISVSREDGIQIIDYNQTAKRRFIIERNVIEKSDFVGLGLMDEGNTMEDYRAASLPEHIYVFNNTFIDNNYGITGGDNLVAINNIITGSTTLGVKGINGASIVTHNLFFNNGTDAQSSNLDLASSLFVDPLLTSSYKLNNGSPAIDVGIAEYTFKNEQILTIPPSDYNGGAPDLGAFEHE